MFTSRYILNPIGGGGGDFYPTPPDYQLPLWNYLSYDSKNFMTSCLHIYATIRETFIRIDRPEGGGGGGATTVTIQTSSHEKLETWKFFFLLKMAEINRE